MTTIEYSHILQRNFHCIRQNMIDLELPYESLLSMYVDHRNRITSEELTELRAINEATMNAAASLAFGTN